MLSHRVRIAMCLVAAGFITCANAAEAANPPTPSGAHPRLFMSPTNLAAYKANAAKPGTSAAKFVSACQATIANPQDYTTRGGADGNNWPGAAVACAFAYQVTQKPEHLAQAIKYWQASLDDDQTIGDKKGCVAGVNTNWQSWGGSPPAPPVILTVTHDTGYPIRWYGPYISLTYDWLHDAPGVPAGLLTQTQTCLTNWVDYYTDRGYHHDEAGANYGAGYVASIAVASVAIGTDGGADGHLWTQALDTVFQKMLIGEGLKGASGTFGTPAGVLVGGDWAEGWQYGPFSVLNYAAATRALTDHGASLPEMNAWVDSLIVRYAHGNIPTMDAQWAGGDFDSEDVYQSPTENLVDAVLLGPSTDTAASWAAYYKQQQKLSGGDFIWNAIAETRTVTPADYRAQTPAPPLWYLSRGTRTVYARNSWDAAAYWGVFASSPSNVSDHQHFAASNFVFNRGGDALVVDSSNYGEFATFASNAVTVDAPGLPGDYAKTQTPWSEADLPWARGTSDAVYGARSDFAKAFAFNGKPSTIPYAHREWTMLPEGEIVTIDRVRTPDAAHPMYVQFHTNTKGSLALAGGVAKGTAGGSALAIHTVSLSAGTPKITQPVVGTCPAEAMGQCNYPCGSCDAARFPVDEYSVEVAGPWAVAIHVIDGLAAAEAPAVVGSINDDTYDPAPKLNAGVIGAAVHRGGKQSYVVASSAMDGAAGDTMTYGVPGGSPSRHVVFDAPEAADGTAAVAATVQGGRCAITITKGAGAGLVGRPLMFSVSGASDGCKVTQSTDVGPGEPPMGTGGAGGSGGGSGGGTQAGMGGTAQAGTGGAAQAGTGGTATGGSATGGAAGKSGTAGAGGATGGAGKAGSGGAKAGAGGAKSGAAGSAPKAGSGGTAGAPSNAAAADDGDSGGCGCAVPANTAQTRSAAALVGLALLFARRRRSRAN